MSSTLEEPQAESLPEPVEHGPDVSVLTDKVPHHLRATRAVAGITLVLGLVFVMYCSLPIWHTDVWGHLSYGRYIWENKSLPQTEPLLPFAKGMPFVDSPWLSQLIGYTVVSSTRLQLAGLQGLFAIAVTCCTAMLAWRTLQQTKNGWFALLSLSTFLLIGSIQLSILRPQLGGMVCFTYLLTRTVRPTFSKRDWIVVPLVFALWANLHASFMMGLALLGCLCLGRAVDVLRRTGSVARVLTDAQTRRYFLLTELGTAAVLINPYTIQLYVEVLRFSQNENLADLTEWYPLTLRDAQGQVFVGVSIVLAALYRLSPRRVRTWEVLSLVGFGLATMWSTRMIVWWAPIAAFLLAQHTFAVWRAFRHSPFVPEPAARAGKWSLVTIGLIWICFMLSPLGVAVMHGKHSAPSRALSTFTPRFAAEYLTKNPPQGPLFNTYEWGDYLLWAGPRDLQLFVNSHAHLIPRDVWMAYMQVIEQRTGWEETLDRYGINTIVIDLTNRESLVKKLKEDPKWQSPVAERDGQVIFTRKKPILSSTSNSEPFKPAGEKHEDNETSLESH